MISRLFRLRPPALGCFLAMAACAFVADPARAQGMTGPETNREFRGAWIATVANIDWPSSRGLSTAEQQAELTAMLDKAVEYHLNAVIFQVRPMGDALYESRLEPWSEFLTGQAGRAPSPFYDPLAFVIEESHKRGLELHAWFNPYRAKHPSARSELPRNHISRTRPEITREYGRYLWLDPTDERTKRHTLDVILDVVRRYNVDGVHIDDYFYPYRSYADGADFPDDANWEAYRRQGGRLDRADWRRSHVNDFVRRLYEEVKREDRRVRVGISPFGIWRPNNPPGIQGLDQYNVLYADAKLWLNEGWLDYFSPQLYWPIDQAPQSYTRLLAWWVGENRHRRHVWPGNFTSRIDNTPRSWDPEEIVNQIRVTREQAGASGNIHFSMIALSENRKGIGDRLRGTVYAEPALPPASPWLGNQPPQPPRASIQRARSGELVISWENSVRDDVRVWVLHFRRDNRWSMRVIPAHDVRTHTTRMRGDAGVTDLAISAVDRLGNESARAFLRVPGE